MWDRANHSPLWFCLTVLDSLWQRQGRKQLQLLHIPDLYRLCSLPPFPEFYILVQKVNICYHLLQDSGFEILFAIFSQVYEAICKKRIWKREVLTLILNMAVSWFQMSVISITFCSVILLMALTENTIVNQLYKHWDFGKYYEYLSHEAKLHFLFDDSSGRGSEPDCYLEIFVTALRISLLLPSMLLVPFLDVLLLLVPFCLWRIMCSFERFCRNNIGGPEATARVSS